MRRVLLLLVVALVTAGLYGAHARSSAVTADGGRISAPAMTAEISAIAHTPVLQCYLGAIAQNGFVSGAGADTVSQSATAAWTNLRVQGLVIDSYVHHRYKYVPSSAALTNATMAFEDEMIAAAHQYSLTCPGTAAQALAAMPAELRRAEVLDQANSLYLLTQLKSTVPLTLASMENYYHKHLADFRSTCVSLALVPRAKVPAFTKAVRRGESVAALARQFSADASAKKGGAYGCYSATSSSYSSVEKDIKGVPLNHYGPEISYDGGLYGLYVAPTSITQASFASVAGTILNDLRSANAAVASKVTQALLYYSAVSVDPSLGQWGQSSNGVGVSALTVPSTTDVTAATLLAGTTAPTYR